MREYTRGHNVVIRTLHIWMAPEVEKESSDGFMANNDRTGSGSAAGPSHRVSYLAHRLTLLPGTPFCSEDEGDFPSVSATNAEEDTFVYRGSGEAEEEFSFEESSSEEELEPIDGSEVRKVTQLHCTKWPGPIFLHGQFSPAQILVFPSLLK